MRFRTPKHQRTLKDHRFNCCIMCPFSNGWLMLSGTIHQVGRKRCCLWQYWTPRDQSRMEMQTNLPTPWQWKFLPRRALPTWLLFKGFLATLRSFSVPSIPLRTSMKSLLETDEINFARFLSELPASFTFSSTFFWCFRTALNNWTTPLEVKYVVRYRDRPASTKTTQYAIRQAICSQNALIWIPPPCHSSISRKKGGYRNT